VKRVSYSDLYLFSCLSYVVWSVIAEPSWATLWGALKTLFFHGFGVFWCLALWIDIRNGTTPLQEEKALERARHKLIPISVVLERARRKRQAVT